jgi:valine--pyruvate aminotransferase
MKLSRFANRFNKDVGIVQLMEDLGEAMASDDEILMLGGGNPAHIPDVQTVFRNRMQQLLDNKNEFARLIGNYDSPRGEKQFIKTLAEFFNRNYDWGISSKNIVLTSGSQMGYFLLFNAFAGEFADGAQRQILLPMVPEYIGYADVGLQDNLFTAELPKIDLLDEHMFKYSIDFDHLKIDENIAAICVSRPTNPSGNVLTDREMGQLHAIAEENDIPLIIDNAYGAPFPNIIFTDATIEWTQRTVFTMSLSKLGLPSARTGIIIANEEITTAISHMNGVINLALGSLGPGLVIDLIQTDKIIGLCKDKIKPFYETKAAMAVSQIKKALRGINYYIHKPEGAMFLWLWIPELPVTNQNLYERLKDKGVFVISGHHFFPGLKKSPWQHQHECIRISYAMDDMLVINGINLIAEEIKSIML